MRIVQLSDIHLSKENLNELENFYLNSLIKDLILFNNEKKIDIIIFSGDLLDKGGVSFKEKDGYDIFEKVFIQPIMVNIGINKEDILFIPGNHDINEDCINQENEFFLENKLNKELANQKLVENTSDFNSSNIRIKKFKDFEKRVHQNNKNYIYTNNESIYIKECEDGKVGFALINDSWRCSSKLKKENHFFGVNQLFNAQKYFQKENTKVNIAVFHHPIELLSNTESEDVENILKSQNFDLILFGHKHEHKIESVISINGGFVSLNGRSAYKNSSEKESRFQSGYNIIDLDVKNKSYKLNARKFIREGFRFDKDVDSLIDGFSEGSLIVNDYYKLTKNFTITDDELPSGYSADVSRIVKLLIGKSLYPNPYIFTRELIQNAVDACSRRSETNTYIYPKIIIKINVEENFFEVIDNGDGMSKKILKEHFSIIGKSISQEFNEGTGYFNLISQFGIGFISTFIVAEKVFISTKTDFENQIAFEIENVFKEFKYTIFDDVKSSSSERVGTSVRVYLKKNYRLADVFHYVKHYCRHIPNLELYLNNDLQSFKESWGIEEGLYFYTEKNSNYECRLTMSNHSRNIIASNYGFLINQGPSQIVPYRFPAYIGGECKSSS